MSVITKGNPFTHAEETRESFHNRYHGHSVDSCAWCGSSPLMLFKYNESRGLFCNKSCWRSYNGQ